MSNLPAQIDDLERVAELQIKGYKPPEIARALGLSTVQVKRLITANKEIIVNRVQDDPEFMDRLQENTIEALDKFDLLLKEAWETYDTAKSMDMINQQLVAIKTIKELEIERAKLLQLMGAKVDSGMLARMNKAEKVNAIVSGIIKDVVSSCPRCKPEAMMALAEAFTIMERGEEVVDVEPQEYIDVEEVEESEHTHGNMMADIFSDD